MAAALHGLLVIDKPSGLTSRDVVNRVQRWFPPPTRIGHTGTLDPLATGVLVLCIGTATRLTEYVQRMDKTYEVGIHLGARSNTDDADGTIQRSAYSGSPPDRAAIAACLQRFIGEIEQVPPNYSAARVAGRRAYDLARRGREVDLEPRRVRIHSVDMLAFAYPRLDLRVRCGKGTYIRSLARDLGNQLGCGAYVAALRRTRVGLFDAADALPLNTDGAAVASRLIPVEAAVAELPRLTLPEADLARLRQGQAVPCVQLLDKIAPGNEIAVFDNAHRLAAVVLTGEQSLLLPDKILNW